MAKSIQRRIDEQTAAYEQLLRLDAWTMEQADNTLRKGRLALTQMAGLARAILNVQEERRKNREPR